MDIPKNSDKFKKDEEKIKSKIESVEKEINEDLSLIPEYQLLTVYDKINKILNENERKFSILKKKFLFKDKTLTGYLNLRDFHDILNNNLTLEKDELKILLCDPALRHKINPNLYQYKPFLDKLSNFNENALSKMKYEYNIEQNKYLTDLRNTIKIKNIDLEKVWNNIYKDNMKCTKNNFYLFFNEIKSNYAYHYLEIEYIFNLISEKVKEGEDYIKLETFQKIMRRRADSDLRVLFFKKIKKEKEKEEKKDEEKILINYYPNILDNNANTNNNINNENNNNEKTNYIILKEEQNINNDNNNEENNNEKFILGNINPNTSLNDSIKEQQNKIVNTVVQKFELPQSLIFDGQSQNNENKDGVEHAKTQVIPSKGIVLKKYNKTIYNIKDKLLDNTLILKDKIYSDEIKTKTQIELDDALKKRIEKSNEVVNNILSKHEEYIVLKLYSSLNYQLNFIDANILMKFKNKDSLNKNLLSFNDFNSILQDDLKLKFNQNDLNLLLNSLENKDISNSLFSYEEFIKNLNNRDSNNDKIKKIENLAQINFNLYLIDFKKFIINNNLDINNIFNAVSNNKKSLDLNEFISFCDCIKYKLSNIKEYKYIFDVITRDKAKKILSKNDLNIFIDSEIISESKFIEDGKCQKNFGKNINKNWYKYIPKYNLNNESFNLKYMNNFEKLFLIINKQRIKFGIYNFADFFSDICNVDMNGNIYKEDFIKALSIIEIINQPIINELLNYLEDIYNKNKFQLTNFLGIFEVFYPQEKSLKKPPYNFKTYPKNPKIIFKNNYGYFISDDIRNIKELCSHIYEIIYYVKRQTIYNYFIKFDFYQKGYFTLEQLKLILIDDLNINKYELIDLFLSYILDNEIMNFSYIIRFNYLIEVITKYTGIKSEDEDSVLRKTFNYSDEINDKLLGSTIMNIRLNKRPESTYIYSPNSGIY